LSHSYWICFFFFFSSRRRHTRFSRDWSSDVCSSDLQLGFRTINEMVGRAQFLKKREDVGHWKAAKVDFSGILHVARNEVGQSLYNTEEQDHGMSMILDWGLLKQAKEALENKTPVFGTFKVKNTDRTI